jgi:mRNA interferase MazF
VTCERWDVMVVPFPFTEKAGAKKRPALVLSGSSFHHAGHSILAMITSRGHNPWPGDTAIGDLEAAGLRVPCIVRMKLFTLDNRLLLSRVGTLARPDAASVHDALRSALP